MRYLLLSDIHANVYALDAVIDCARGLDFDEVIFLGDMFGYYPWVRETWELWSAWDVPKHHLLGNHDILVISGTVDEIVPYEPAISVAREQLPREVVDYLSTLHPYGTCLEIICFHGSPADPLNGRAYPDTPPDVFLGPLAREEYIALGHTHYPMIRTFDGTVIINPGSVGQPRDHDGRASCAIVNTEARDVQFYRIPYDVTDVMRKLYRMHWPDAFIRSLDKKRGEGSS